MSDCESHFVSYEVLKQFVSPTENTGLSVTVSQLWAKCESSLAKRIGIALATSHPLISRRRGLKNGACDAQG